MSTKYNKSKMNIHRSFEGSGCLKYFIEESALKISTKNFRKNCEKLLTSDAGGGIITKRVGICPPKLSRISVLTLPPECVGLILWSIFWCALCAYGNSYAFFYGGNQPLAPRIYRSTRTSDTRRFVLLVRMGNSLGSCPRPLRLSMRTVAVSISF